MHISNLRDAERLSEQLKTLAKLRDTLSAFPSFTPRMVVNGVSVDLSQDEAWSIAARFSNDLQQRFLAIGLQVDTDEFLSLTP